MPTNASRNSYSSPKLRVWSRSIMPLSSDTTSEIRNGERQSRKTHQSTESNVQVLDLTDSNSAPGSPSYASTVTSPSPAASPSSPGSKMRLSLDHFAFAASAPTVTAHKGPAPPSKIPRRSRRRRPPLSTVGVSVAALSQLTGCVCCETRWTVKKTAAQKLSHMDACSKKRSYSPETMSLLIKKELNVPENATADGAEISTHFRSVVQDARPKKRQKNSGPTVQQYTRQAREIILKRARMILGPTVNLDESNAFHDLSVSTQAVGPWRSVTSTSVVTLDLPFRPSRLKYQSREGSGPKDTHQCDQLRNI